MFEHSKIRIRRANLSKIHRQECLCHVCLSPLRPSSSFINHTSLPPPGGPRCSRKRPHSDGSAGNYTPGLLFSIFALPFAFLWLDCNLSSAFSFFILLS